MLNPKRRFSVLCPNLLAVHRCLGSAEIPRFRERLLLKAGEYRRAPAGICWHVSRPARLDTATVGGGRGAQSPISHSRIGHAHLPANRRRERAPRRCYRLGRATERSYQFLELLEVCQHSARLGGPDAPAGIPPALEVSRLDAQITGEVHTS